jgi:WXG100 family type VII secretion target
VATPKVRADYEALKQVAASFGGQAQAARQTLQSLNSQLEVLQGGDWVGQGATAFYQEMGSQVMPTMKRLAGALENAQRSTLQISQIMQAAEDEAARVLRGDGGGAAGAAAGAGAMLGAAAGAAAGVAGAAAAAAAGAAAGVAAGAAAAVEAAQDASVDRTLSKFDPKVRDLVKQSPTLRAEVLKLEQAGYSFKTGPVADGYYTDWTGKVITIDQPLGDATTVAHIAHEVGHGVSNQQQSIPATPTMTRDQYVNQNVDNLMHNEGEAQFNAATVRAELKAAGGPDTGIPGSQTAAYQKSYDDYTAGTITKDQAIGQMGTLMGNEHVSIPPYQAYHDYYADSFKADFDKNIAPTRAKP